VGLIRYLAKNNHWTPFAHPQITLRIKAPISIRTQFFKHKQGFVENEVSRRYISDKPEFYKPHWRSKPENGAKQGSEDFMEQPSAQIATIQYRRLMNHALKTYDSLLKRGVAPEQARFVLPQGMYTEWYWTGSLFAYARFYKLRIHEHAQWEIRQYAEEISNIIKPLYPISWGFLTK
jgi:thymidylate synthase (FAD)